MRYIKKILPMAKNDILELERLEKMCFSSPWTSSALLEELENPQAHFLVCRVGNTIVGYIGVQEICGEAYITSICVLPEFRRQGIADTLLCHAQEGAKGRGCVFITLEVRKSNNQAIKLYEKNSYSIMGERKNFYSSPMENALIMTKYFNTELL
ncbi:MAG TPA: ribosomal protein S18-alanine N-acetyltransferase [Clostridia bacterium]|nr:ribosomal protein S18-alanine N-acetyltransferase [Clostridia bacterium]